ncbi:unnamed protein product [Timema podura]|uniref:Cationic amino acid transporter C-terminal domain-containing protein n=1 Tax=Timema podura TaxID=61482 RepID=A0ABN7NNI9_TIMPD|nr:unnamed protein product [Timema podura]
MMWPYYKQDEDAPIPFVFREVGWPIAQWIVAVGGIFGLCARYKAELDEEGYSLLLTQLGDIADSSDNSEGELEEKTGSVYKDNPDDGSDIISSEYIESTNLVTLKEVNTFESITKQLFNIRRLKCPTPLSSNIVAIQVFIFCVISTIANLCIVHFMSEIIAGHLVVTVITSLAFILLCLILFSIARQPTSSKILSFKVPLVPLLPALSILININLMLMLDIHTWIRFGVWMIAGLVDYFFYGMWQSGATHSKRKGIKKTRLGHENKGFIPDDQKPTSDRENPKTSQGAMNVSQESNKRVTPLSPSEINKTNENKIDSECKQEILLNHNRDEVMRTSVYIGNQVDENQYISSSQKFRNNTSVSGGDSIRSYVSVKNKSVGGGGNVVLSNAFDVSSSNVLTMSQNSEHFPIKVLSNNDVRFGQNQETVSEVSGHVRENVTSSKNTNNGVVNETEEDLYPNVIVIPHGDADGDSQGESFKIEGESEADYEEDENCTAERSDDEQINNNEKGPLNDTKDPNKVSRNYETQESELSGERSSQDSFHSAVDVIGEQRSEKMVDKLESETNDIDEINNLEESKYSKTKDLNEADATVENNLNELDRTQSTLNIDKSPASLMLKGSFKTSSFAKRLDKLLQKTSLIGKSNSRHTLNMAASDINQQPGISKTLDLKRDKYATEKLETSESMNQYDQNENNSGSSTIDNFEVLKKQQIMGGLSSLKFVKKGLSEDESSSGSEDEVFVDTVDPKRKLETR